MLDEICIALWFKFVRVFETWCFSRKSWKVWILSLFTLHFPQGKWKASWEVVWQCHRESSQRFGLRTSKEGAIQRSHDFAEWERLYVRGGEGGEVPVLTHKDFAHFECMPSDTSRGALEKYWFGQSQPSTDGEVEFSIEKS